MPKDFDSLPELSSGVVKLRKRVVKLRKRNKETK